MKRHGSALLDVTGLTVEYRRGRERVRAVDGVSFRVAAGETLGLIGESGSGKSSLGRAVLRLLPARSGTVRFDGVDVHALSRHALRTLRPRMQMIFQDPMSSMNPRMTVGRIISEPLVEHRLLSGAAVERRVASLLDDVGLTGRSAHRYPHEFSGGQRQRVAVARALALQPDLLVCDEPTSALDVSVQAQILELLRHVQAERGLALLFISHDLGVVRYLSDRIAVMRSAELVEQGDVALLDAPAHEYTRLLLAAAPRLGGGTGQEGT